MGLSWPVREPYNWWNSFETHTPSLEGKTFLSELYLTLRMDVKSYRASKCAPAFQPCLIVVVRIFPGLDNGAHISVLPNIRYAATSHPFSKWDKVCKPIRGNDCMWRSWMVLPIWNKHPPFFNLTYQWLIWCLWQDQFFSYMFVWL